MKFERLFYIGLGLVVISGAFLLSYFLPVFNTAGASASSVKKIYFVDHISSAHQKVINRFNEINKGRIEVEAINLPFNKFSTNERKELLARYLRSKSDRIDIFSADQIWVPRFAKWCISLDKFIPEAEKNNLLDFAMQSCYYNDSLVALPLYIDIALMYYRTDIINTLPNHEQIEKKLSESITWEDFIALKEQLGDQYPFFLFQADDFEGLICIFTEMMLNQKKPILIEGKLQLNTLEARKSLQLLVDMVNKYNVSPRIVTQLKENPSYTYFIDNNGVFLRGWTAFQSRESRKIFKNNKIFDHLQGVPTAHFKGYDPVSVYGGWNLMISKFSTRIPEAIKFMNFLVSEEAQKILYEEATLLPVNTSIYKDSAYVNMHDELRLFYSLLKKGVHRSFTERYTAISDILSYYINRAIKKEISVDDALAKASEKINSNSILIK